ncbi:hypothetical protein IC762_12300 [Bradyrhizobium genosp. L]|uniref:hypothetical protein n=1 Tax=Bradyrhizobium genosp. L TaxID=83637 RepID=UPI0018A260EC|nr:hypothetical protein [Bradyrhizobium genosp. L]QPF87026.1 hypothetical protein IC762_12300 [Bradyrhizobium genosp. L]
MSAILDSELVKRTKDKLDAEDRRAVDIMSGGMLTDWGQYQRSAGYRKAIADAKQLLEETWQEIQEE